MRRGVWLAWIPFLALALVAAGLGLIKHLAQDAQAGDQAWEPAESVEVVPARTITWRPTAELVGTVFALRSVRLQNELSGRVREVSFASGAVVESGQVLLTLDDALEQAELQAALASIEVALAAADAGEAQLRLAETELRRLQQMAATVATELELDRARAARDDARAQRARLRAEVELARARAAQVRARLAKLTLRAPFRARAGIRAVHEGQFLAEGTTIVGLEEVSERVYLDFAIPQDYASRARPGLTILADCPLLGQAPLPIEVVAVDAQVDNDTRNLRVRAVVSDPAGRLLPGMFVPIRVPVEEPREEVVVPATAVRRTSWADQVFVVAPGPDGAPRAAMRFVKLGPTVGQDVVVLEGLAAGEPVAATGSFKLRDGAKVQPAGAGPPGVAAEGAAAAPVESGAHGAGTAR